MTYKNYTHFLVGWRREHRRDTTNAQIVQKEWGGDTEHETVYGLTKRTGVWLFGQPLQLGSRNAKISSRPGFGDKQKMGVSREQV